MLARLLADEGIGGGDDRSIAPRTDVSSAPLSFAQEVVWLLDRASPGLSAYNVSMARRLRGPIDLAALARALNELVARHDSLRTTFRAFEDTAVVDVRPYACIEPVIEDLRDLPSGEREDAAMNALRRHADASFDLATDLPFRAVIALIADTELILMIVTHHIVSDARSYAIMFEELSALYAGARTQTGHGLPPVPLQFADVAAWQRETFRGAELARRLEYWRERLSGIGPLPLPTDRPATHIAGAPGAVIAADVPHETCAALRAAGKRYNVSPYMILLAAWQTLLHRYSGATDIVVGSAVAGRTRSEMENIVGFFAQALPMRTSFERDPTFATVLSRVSETVLGAFEHQEVPLDALAFGGAGLPEPLFRTVLTMVDEPREPVCFGETTCEPVTVDTSQTKFDLTLFPRDDGVSIALTLAYRTDVFDRTTACRMLTHFLRILAVGTSDASLRVSRIPMLTDDERAQLAAWNATEHAGLAIEFVHAQFAACAIRTPNALAVTCGEVSLTYGELESRANRLAHRLHACGLAAGDRVAIVVERGIAAIVALLAILKAGAAYVPIAPDAPRARVEQQIADAGIHVALVATPDAEALLLAAGCTTVVSIADPTLDDESQGPLDVRVGWDDLAYVLYTSGSTGRPKGVCITHRNIAAYTAAMRERLGVAAAPLAFATVSPLTADLGNTSLFPALTSGAPLHVVPSAVATDAAQFAAYARRVGIDVLKITPTHLRALLDSDDGTMLPLRWLILGGEPCPWTLADAVLANGRAPRVLNHYGPTETTVGACTFEITATSMLAARAAGAQTAPIGTPLSGAHAHVMDVHGELVPIGVPGELFLSGAGVARGYLGRPDLTAERFEERPGLGRTYRTGDRVRRLSTGDLEYLGRTDHQVKIRGFRVEPGEIESTLLQLPGVAQTIVMPRDEGGEIRLIAYVVLSKSVRAETFSSVARAHLLSQMPAYMLPSAFFVLDAFPRTLNGKVDRAALACGTDEDCPMYEAPATPTESTVAKIWADVLGCARVGATDHFFALGGHSLTAIRVLGKISRSCGVRLPLRTLFDTPQLRALAKAIDHASADGTASSPPPIALVARVRRNDGAVR